MISVRRLRAVLLFATVSAVLWGVVGTAIGVGFALKLGQPLGNISFWSPFIIFAYCGFTAGALYAVGIAMVPLRRDQQGLSALRSSIFGAVAGVLVFLAIALGVGEFNALLTPTVIFGSIGAAAGVAIQRTAARGRLSAGADAAGTEFLTEGTDG